MDKQVVVCCPIKNDNEYLVEFVEHYLKLGFDKIYFYDNNEDESDRPETVLFEYLLNNTVELINYRGIRFIDYIVRVDFFTKYDFEWVLFVDDDEFLELKKHNNIKDFIGSFNVNATKIVFNNLHYGDNEELFYRNENVQDRFKVPASLDILLGGFIVNSAIKSMNKKVPINDGDYLTAHLLFNSEPYYNADGNIVEVDGWRIKNDSQITFETAYIKHYITKSLEEFIKIKIKRSKDGNYASRFDMDDYYYLYNKKTEEKEVLANYFLNT